MVWKGWISSCGILSLIMSDEYSEEEESGSEYDSDGV